MVLFAPAFVSSLFRHLEVDGSIEKAHSVTCQNILDGWWSGERVIQAPLYDVQALESDLNSEADFTEAGVRGAVVLRQERNSLEELR